MIDKQERIRRGGGSGGGAKAGHRGVGSRQARQRRIGRGRGRQSRTDHFDRRRRVLGGYIKLAAENLARVTTRVKRTDRGRSAGAAKYRIADARIGYRGVPHGVELVAVVAHGTLWLQVCIVVWHGEDGAGVDVATRIDASDHPVDRGRVAGGGAGRADGEIVTSQCEVLAVAGKHQGALSPGLAAQSEGMRVAGIGIGQGD